MHSRAGWSKWIWVGLALVAVLLLSACNESEKNVEQSGKIVAEYDGGKVTETQFNQFLNIMRTLNPNYEEAEKQPDYKQQMLEAYVSYIYVKKVVNSKDVANIEQDVNSQLTRLEQDMNQYFGENGFNKRLQDNKVTKDELNDYLQDRYYLMKYVGSLVSEESVKAKYEEQKKAGELKSTVATVSHILIGTNEGQENARTKEEALAKAKEVLKEITDGLDFAAAAKKYSEDPGSKDNGGEYADANVDDWVPEFKQAAITLPLNTISEPVETQYGYHIMKVSKRSEKVKTYEDVNAELRNELSQAEFEKYMETSVKPTIKNVKLD